MPKILRILNRFNLGGPVHNASILSRYLSADYQTLLIGGCKEEVEADGQYIAKELGLEPIIIPELRRSVHPGDDVRAYHQISQIIDGYQPDIVHTHASKAGVLGRIAAKKKGVKVIVHTFHGHVFHSYFGPVKSSFYKYVERRLAMQSSGIIALCDNQKEELSEKYRIAPPEKITVIPLGFDLTRFRENRQEKRLAFRKKYCLEDDEIAVGIVGRLTAIKNHRLFLQALKQVKKNSEKRIRAFIIGDGELKNDLRSFCYQNNFSCNVDTDSPRLRKDVIFTSWIKQIDSVYPGLDIVAMTSLNEGTPVSLVEAQAAGVPIVATDVGGTKSIVAPGKTALLADNNSEGDFPQQFLKLIESEELRSHFANNGWQQVKDKFHYSRLVSEMETLYEELLD